MAPITAEAAIGAMAPCVLLVYRRGLPKPVPSRDPGEDQCQGHHADAEQQVQAVVEAVQRHEVPG
ncbi:hypothetical protein QFZ40_002972 [Arthrobacter pascens]|uniref:hypothetical protein n=1 Tax=Arthrobacter pascens TaxID=1677 RepID=UPI0027834FDA|nr:hypothetical protein [Arthrobacter pascens]